MALIHIHLRRSSHVDDDNVPMTTDHTGLIGLAITDINIRPKCIATSQSIGRESKIAAYIKPDFLAKKEKDQVNWRGILNCLLKR